MREGPTVSRRGFGKRILVGVGGLGFVGGVVGMHRAYSASQLGSQMMGRAARTISDKERAEIEELPTLAREQIRCAIHGSCLDAHRFADEVCRPSFRERLAACQNDEERQREFHLAFNKYLISEAELNNRLRTIAAEMGARLDHNWADCCHRVAESWGVALRPYETDFAVDRLADWAEPIVRQRIETAVRETTTATLRPALEVICESLGKSAMLLLPVMVEAPFVGVPVFAALAFRPVFEFFARLFRTPQADVRDRVTAHLAVLSERLGTEFQREVRCRIAELHSWQYGAIRDVARQQAWRSVGWL